jgi:hypothetical protein
MWHFDLPFNNIIDSFTEVLTISATWRNEDSLLSNTRRLCSFQICHRNRKMIQAFNVCCFLVPALGTVAIQSPMSKWFMTLPPELL